MRYGNELSGSRKPRVPYGDLASLARTSRKMHAIYNPILYCSNRDFDMSTVMIWAAAKGRIETLERATGFGLPLSPKIEAPQSLWGDTILLDTTILVATSRKREATIAWLVDHGVKVDDGRLLFLALKSKWASTARLLIDRGARLVFEADYNNREPEERTIPAIHVATTHGLIEVVRYVVEQKGIDINMCDDKGYSCLHYAASTVKKPAITKGLLKLRADVDPTGNETSPLFMAVEARNYRVAHALLDARSSVSRRSTSGLLPIHLAIQQHQEFSKIDTDLWSLLRRLSSLDADLNATPVTQGVPTPLVEAITNGSAKTMEILIRAGADINQLVDGKSPLGFAWDDFLNTRLHPPNRETRRRYPRWQESRKLKLLLQNGLSLDSPYNEDGDSLLSVALSHCVPPDMHLTCGALKGLLGMVFGSSKPLPKRDTLLSIDTTNSTPSDSQSSCRTLQGVLSMMAKSSTKDLQDGFLDSVLAHFVRQRNITCCSTLQHCFDAKLTEESHAEATEWAKEILLARGCQCYDRATAWHLESVLHLGVGFNATTGFLTMALKQRHSEVVNVIWDYRSAVGQNQNHRDPNVWLHDAIEWGDTEIILKVLGGSPDVNGFDSEGWLPLARAVRNEHYGAAQILIDHGADAWLATRTHQPLTAVQLAIMCYTPRVEARTVEPYMLKIIMKKQPGKIPDKDLEMAPKAIIEALRRWKEDGIISEPNQSYPDRG
ncbi:ankyrin repeat-containing domain protein [Hypoxylon sp. FL1150]|nr:ankyrin repeat-containing domain protein [Hypoxylon sp. FL1150]